MMKETSAIFIDLCDKIVIKGNTFSRNWSVSTGDSYVGSSLNIYRALSFHGIDILDNTFKDHEGVPEYIVRQNIISKLYLDK